MSTYQYYWATCPLCDWTTIETIWLDEVVDAAKEHREDTGHDAQVKRAEDSAP